MSEEATISIYRGDPHARIDNLMDIFIACLKYQAELLQQGTPADEALYQVAHELQTKWTNLRLGNPMYEGLENAIRPDRH